VLERRVVEAVLVEAIQQEKKGIGRVRVALTTCLETFGRYRRPAKILLVQAVGLGTTFENKRNEINDRFAYLIQTYLDESVEVGDIPPVDTEIVSIAWMGAIYNVVIRWVNTGEPDSERIMQALLPVLLKSVGYEE
jgi:hypothetical protein